MKIQNRISQIFCSEYVTSYALWKGNKNTFTILITVKIKVTFKK